MNEADYEVIIVGAGFGGIGAGMMLRRAGIDDFLIIEKAGAVGGTWRDNVYPNIAVDIPSLLYQFSFERNPDWTRVFAPGAEVQAYAVDCVRKYRLDENLRLGTEVLDMVFDEERGVWNVRLEERTLTARFVISALGALTQPKLPDIPGLGDFAGTSLHTQRWDPDIDLAGKRVGVVGTGATAVQLVPWVAKRAAQTSVFQRTPIWVMPKPDWRIPRTLRWAYRNIPGLQRAAFAATLPIVEAIMTLGVIYNRQMQVLTGVVERTGRAWLRRQVPDPVLREKLTPEYGFGCKRPTMSNDYLRTFMRPDTDLVTDPIQRVTPSGIATADGVHHDLDVLVLATGFLVTEPENLPSVPIVGREGLGLREFWAEHRLQAYEGTTMPGFPNLFLVFGPYALIGSSWMFMIEYQVTHAIRVIEETRRRGAASAEIRQEPNDRFFAQVQNRMPSTVFFANNCGGANSYYFDQRGDAPFLRPSTMLEAWWRARHFDLDHYRYEPAPSSPERLAPVADMAAEDAPAVGAGAATHEVSA